RGRVQQERGAAVAGLVRLAAPVGDECAGLLLVRDGREEREEARPLDLDLRLHGAGHGAIGRRIGHGPSLSVGTDSSACRGAVRTSGWRRPPAVVRWEERATRPAAHLGRVRTAHPRRSAMLEFTEDELDDIRSESQRAYDLDRAHVFHSWSAQKQLTPMVVSRAAGSYVYDGEGKPFLDFSSQLVNKIGRASCRARV